MLQTGNTQKRFIMIFSFRMLMNKRKIKALTVCNILCNMHIFHEKYMTRTGANIHFVKRVNIE